MIIKHRDGDISPLIRIVTGGCPPDWLRAKKNLGEKNDSVVMVYWQSDLNNQFKSIFDMHARPYQDTCHVQRERRTHILNYCSIVGKIPRSSRARTEGI
jgi:hypothetical protein